MPQGDVGKALQACKEEKMQVYAGGHSLGGALAQQFAACHGRGVVDGLVTFGSLASTSDTTEIGGARFVMEGTGRDGDTDYDFAPGMIPTPDLRAPENPVGVRFPVQKVLGVCAEDDYWKALHVPGQFEVERTCPAPLAKPATDPDVASFPAQKVDYHLQQFGGGAPLPSLDRVVGFILPVLMKLPVADMIFSGEDPDTIKAKWKEICQADSECAMKFLQHNPEEAMAMLMGGGSPGGSSGGSPGDVGAPGGSPGGLA